MCTTRALQQESCVGSNGCTVHAAMHAGFQCVRSSRTEIRKLVNMSGPDRAGHSSVHAGFYWLLLHDIHMAVHGVNCSARCFKHLQILQMNGTAAVLCTSRECCYRGATPISTQGRFYAGRFALSASILGCITAPDAAIWSLPSL